MYPLVTRIAVVERGRREVGHENPEHGSEVAKLLGNNFNYLVTTRIPVFRISSLRFPDSPKVCSFAVSSGTLSPLRAPLAENR